MIIIPAVDIRGGKCVRLRQGRAEEETVFSEDPVKMGRKWYELGAEYLHVVDLDGAFSGKPANMELVRAIAQAVKCPVELGGGLRTDEAVAQGIEAGAARVVVGTRAATDREWLEKLAKEYPGKIAVGIDARDGMVSVKGWTEKSTRRAIDLVEELNAVALAAIIYTDIARDGEMMGPNLASTGEVIKKSRHAVIASGGVSRTEDVKKLARLGASAAIIGRALYEGTLTLEEAMEAGKS